MKKVFFKLRNYSCTRIKKFAFPFFSFWRRCLIGLTVKTQRCGTHIPKICPREYQFYFSCFSHGALYENSILMTCFPINKGRCFSSFKCQRGKIIVEPLPSNLFLYFQISLIKTGECCPTLSSLPRWSMFMHSGKRGRSPRPRPLVASCRRRMDTVER